ncbi:MAG: adenine phosphoribosyltransferase [Propionibacteriaceae bacterium]|nr:adenine phosphoribosyltransferase [Propionibacteriaceae bacterium]
MSVTGPALRHTLSGLIADVADWPTPGVVFKDITPLLADPEALRQTVDALAAMADGPVDMVVGMEARGFIVGAPVALALGAGFVPVRKPGKLPRPTISATFALEYGSDELMLHRDALEPGMRVLIVDDVLATGGTVEATAMLVSSLGATLVGVSVLLELAFLGGRARLEKQGVGPIGSLVTVEA